MAEEAKLAKDFASLESKIAKATVSLNSAKTRLEKEEQKEAKKREKDQVSKQRTTDESIANLQGNVRDVSRAQSKLERRVSRLETLPDKITVLYLTAVPDKVGNIRTDREAREIRDAITRALHRDSINFETRAAVRTSDLFQALNETQPTIVHFSGHGTTSGELVFEDSQGNPKCIAAEKMAAALETMADSVRLAVFNACFSETQAIEVVGSIEAAIGMGDSIDDATAIEFASQLYSAIGFGLSLEKAFEQARVAIDLAGLPGSDTPELFVADGVSASDVVYVNAEAVC